ncbi:DcaP family trimeric outer membrane transporter [uncultured Ramlibacter sp.]|uniref:DcaP family trimeric outer membrane transporter n=1 Tax=uncultured Ramlibacter sp. TaxID=260755 RepID=UPI0026181289|nr:DcaP family trimeric outer membrane transporter [uncultured Ramlibacter sp.]
MHKQLLVALACAVLCGGAQAQSTEELKGLLDQAMRTIGDLQQRVQQLEARQQAQPPALAAVPAAAATTAPASAPAAVSASAPAAAAKPAPDKPQVEVYGQVMLDAISESGRVNPAWQATMRPSQIAVNCPADPGCGKDGALGMSVRQSSLGLRAAIPTGLGVVKTDLAFDLFGTDGGTNIHWLRAWAEVGAWGLGQTDSNFMDIDAYPNVIDYWGPSGMAFVRNPQVRYTGAGGEGLAWAVSLEAPNSVIDTGKLSQVDPALGAGVTAHNRLPDLVGSVRLDRDWGHVKAAAIVRQVGYQTVTTASGDPSGDKTGYGLNLTGVLKLSGRGTLGWGLTGGKAIASYMNDGGTDLAPGAGLRAEAVNSLGYFLYYGHAWDAKLNSSIGYSQHRQDNSSGQAANAFHAGSYASVNLLYTLTDNVLVGGEYIWGRRENKDGSAANAGRLQLSGKVSF